MVNLVHQVAMVPQAKVEVEEVVVIQVDQQELQALVMEHLQEVDQMGEIC